MHALVVAPDKTAFDGNLASFRIVTLKARLPSARCCSHGTKLGVFFIVARVCMGVNSKGEAAVRSGKVPPPFSKARR